MCVTRDSLRKLQLFYIHCEAAVRQTHAKTFKNWCAVKYSRIVESAHTYPRRSMIAIC